MTSDDREPRLRSDVALRRRTLWLGEMELYDDELVISGWRWSGSVWRPIPITEIRQVEKWPAPEGMVNLVVRPEKRDDFYCRVEEGIFYWVKEFREDERTDVKIRH